MSLNVCFLFLARHKTHLLGLAYGRSLVTCLGCKSGELKMLSYMHTYIHTYFFCHEY